MCCNRNLHAHWMQPKYVACWGTEIRVWGLSVRSGEKRATVHSIRMYNVVKVDGVAKATSMEMGSRAPANLLNSVSLKRVTGTTRFLCSFCCNFSHLMNDSFCVRILAICVYGVVRFPRTLYSHRLWYHIWGHRRVLDFFACFSFSVEQTHYSGGASLCIWRGIRAKALSVCGNIKRRDCIMYSTVPLKTYFFFLCNHSFFALMEILFVWCSDIHSIC